jgi:hypothetical protein
MDDPDTDDEILGLAPWQRVVIAISSLIPIAALLAFGAIVAGQLTSKGGSLRIGHGPREPISAATAREILIPIGAVFVLAFLATIFRLVRVARTAPEASASQFDRLGTSEATLWAGRPGLRSATGSRVLLVVLAIAAPFLFALWIWTAWSNARDPALAAVSTIWACLIFFGSAVPGIIVGSGALREWIRDALGRVFVTDRRIAWVAGRDFVYREIVGDSLIGAALIEGQGRYGWVSVTQQVEDDVRECDLFGLPEPDQALVAIERLIALRAPAAISDKIPPTGVEFSNIGR